MIGVENFVIEHGKLFWETKKKVVEFCRFGLFPSLLNRNTLQKNTASHCWRLPKNNSMITKEKYRIKKIFCWCIEHLAVGYEKQTRIFQVIQSDVGLHIHGPCVNWQRTSGSQTRKTNQQTSYSCEPSAGCSLSINTTKHEQWICKPPFDYMTSKMRVCFSYPTIYFLRGIWKGPTVLFAK